MSGFAARKDTGGDENVANIPVRVVRRWMQEGLIVVRAPNSQLDRRKDLEQRVLVSRIDELKEMIEDLKSLAERQAVHIERLEAKVTHLETRHEVVHQGLTALFRSLEAGNASIWTKISRSLNP